MIFRHTDLVEVGVDEVGRGCIAGNVVAGAAYIFSGFSHPKLNDSKQMSEKARDEVFRYIVHSNLCLFGIGMVSAEDIDRDGIVPSTMRAIHLAVEDLQGKMTCDIDILLVDGNYFDGMSLSDRPVRHETFIKGDSRFVPIAAASVAAKVTRDGLMKDLARQHPQFGWERNKGYGTREHMRAVIEHGYTPLHRKTFKFNTT